jgi:hypothetical protein
MNNMKSAGAPETRPPCLRVILHGLCVIQQRRRDLRIFLPNVESQHVYRAGKWLGETTIPPGAKLQLAGVRNEADSRDSKPKEFSPDENVIVRGAFRRSAMKPYATLLFPRPFDIYSLRPAPVTPGHLESSLQDKVSNRGKLATIQVLEYVIDNAANLGLVNVRKRAGDGEEEYFPWVPSLTEESVNLHVFAEPETPQPMDHSLHEFSLGARLFRDLDIRLTSVPKLPRIDRAKLPRLGLPVEELEDLIPRTRRMAMLGRYKHHNRDLNALWDAFEEYGDNVSACTFAVLSEI